MHLIPGEAEERVGAARCTRRERDERDLDGIMTAAQSTGTVATGKKKPRAPTR